LNLWFKDEGRTGTGGGRPFSYLQPEDPAMADSSRLNDRSRLRRQMRTRRRALTPAQRSAAALAVVESVARERLFINARHIAFYLPNDGELDLRPLLAHALALGKRCYLPVLSVPFHNHLWFLPYRENDRLLANRFGIPEPGANKMRGARKPWGLDLILTPLVAFDHSGNRLGMGGGFYDRTLGFLHRRRHWRKPRLLGTAYTFQEVDALPLEPWDVPLDGVITDQGLRLLGERRDGA